MPALFEQLQLAKLSVDERLQLVGDIWDSIAAEADALTLPPAFCEELDRRIAAHRADPSSAIPWDEVRFRAYERLGKRRVDASGRG